MTKIDTYSPGEFKLKQYDIKKFNKYFYIEFIFLVIL